MSECRARPGASCMSTKVQSAAASLFRGCPLALRSRRRAKNCEKTNCIHTGGLFPKKKEGEKTTSSHTQFLKRSNVLAPSGPSAVKELYKHALPPARARGRLRW